MEKSVNIKKNDIFEVEITDQSSSGDGICRIDGFAVFVPRTAVGDLARIRIVKVSKTYGFGRLEQILRASDVRVDPGGAGFDKCGGCDFLHINYETQLKLKRQQVVDALERLGNFKGISVRERRCRLVKIKTEEQFAVFIVDIATIWWKQTPVVCAARLQWRRQNALRNICALQR